LNDLREILEKQIQVSESAIANANQAVGYQLGIRDYAADLLKKLSQPETVNEAKA